MQAPIFDITILYIDKNEEDRQKFRLLVTKQPEFSVFRPKLLLLSHLGQALKWAQENPFKDTDAVTLVCFDPSAGGIDPSASHAAVERLIKAGYSRDCIVALPEPGSKVVWQVLQNRLSTDHILSKPAVFDGDQVSAIAGIISSALSKRTSGGDKNIQLSLMRVEADLKVLESKLDARTEEFRFKVEETILKVINRRIEQSEARLDTLEHSIFPSKDLTGNPSLVTMAMGNRQMSAANAKAIDKLDRDIGDLAELTKSRREEDLARINALRQDIESLRHLVGDLASQKGQAFELRLKRSEFVYSTSSKIILAIALIGLGFLVSRLAPELLDALTKILSSSGLPQRLQAWIPR